MATRVRTFHQLDDFACNTVVGTYLSHDNCLITEPVVDITERTVSGKRIVNVSWTAFITFINGTVVNVSAGNQDLNNDNIPATTFYFIVNSSGNIQFTTSVPSGNYVLISTIRFKSQSNVVTYYFINSANNSIGKAVNKIDTKFWLEKPKYIGGIRPITITDDGSISISEGLAVYGKDLIEIPAISNGKILLDDETEINKLTDITTYSDGSTIPDGAFVGIWVGLNVCGIDINRPFLAVRMDNVYYGSMQDCIDDKFGAVKVGFPVVDYFNTYFPFMVYIFRKGVSKERCYLNLLDAHRENKIVQSSIKHFNDMAIATIANDDFDNIQPQLRYDTITNRTLTIGQTKSCIEVTLNGLSAFDYGGITPSAEANGNYDFTEFLCHFKLTNNVGAMPICGWVNPSSPLTDHILITLSSGYFRIMRNGSYILNTANTFFNYNTNYFLRLIISGGRLTSSVGTYTTRGDFTNVEVFNSNQAITIGTNNYVPIVGVMNYTTNSQYPKFLCDFFVAKRLRPVV